MMSRSRGALARKPGWAVRSGTLAAACLALAACQPAVLDPVGPVGVAERMILFDSLLIMLAIVGPTILVTLGVAWWFRASNPRARYLPNFAHSGRIELVTWGIPLLTITLLGGVTWIGSHQLDPAEPLSSDMPPLNVQVVSLDWKWLFIYPEQHVAAVNQLVIMAGQPVHFQLTSASVMNSFFVPQLGSMLYNMNGMSSDLHLKADQPGNYWGLSTHFSGDGFSDMHFEVRALDAPGFNAWVDEARKDGPVLNAATYAELAKQSIKDPPSTFRDADPELYGRIVNQHIPPAPGPVESGGGQAGQAAKGGTGTARTAAADPATCTTGER